jgi:hypothetical protein
VQQGEAGIAVGSGRLSTIPPLGIVNGVTKLITKLAVVDNEVAGTYTPRFLQAARQFGARRSFPVAFRER